MSTDADRVMELERRDSGLLLEPLVGSIGVDGEGREVTAGGRTRLLGDMDLGRFREGERDDEAEFAPVLVRSTVLLFAVREKKDNCQHRGSFDFPGLLRMTSLNLQGE